MLEHWSSRPQPKARDFPRQGRRSPICSLDPPHALLRVRLRPTADLLTPHPHARLCWAHCRRFLAESSKGWLLSVLLLQKKKLTHRDIKWPDQGRTALSRPLEKVGHQEWGTQVSNCPFSAWLGYPVRVALCPSHGPQMNAPLGRGLRLCPCSWGLLHNSEA